MSLLTRTLVRNINSTRISACNYLYNEVRLSCTQYHTLNTTKKAQFTDFNCNKLVRREVAFLSNIKFKYLDFTSKLADLRKYGIEYIPIIGSPKLTFIGFLWYKSLDKVKIDEFFTLLNLPDTFYSRFKVIELHIWILLHILPQGTRRSNRIRYAIIMAMWEDHQSRAKMLQEFNRNYKKNMKDLYQQFKMSLLLYDVGYNVSDTALANAVWCNLFDKENVDPRYLEALVLFIRHHIDHLNKVNIEKLENEEVKEGFWLPLQPFIDEVFKNAQNY